MRGTYSADCFAVYTNVKSLCCVLATNIMLSINYTTIKNALNVTAREYLRKIYLKNIDWGQIVMKKKLLRNTRLK